MEVLRPFREGYLILIGQVPFILWISLSRPFSRYWYQVQDHSFSPSAGRAGLEMHEKDPDRAGDIPRFSMNKTSGSTPK